MGCSEDRKHCGPSPENSHVGAGQLWGDTFLILKEMLSSSHRHVYTSCPPTARWEMCFHTRASRQLKSCVSFLSELWVGVLPKNQGESAEATASRKQERRKGTLGDNGEGGAQGHQADERRDPRRPDTEGCHHHGVS